MVTIGFLHTAAVHVAVFDALVEELDPGARAVTVVDEALLDDARRCGVADDEVVAGVARAIDALIGGGATAILCTCSTIGGTAEIVGRRRDIDVVRVDRAMAERAVGIGGRILVLAALASTLEPTVSLLSEVAAARGAAPVVEVRVVEGAWSRFEVGDQEGYRALVADAIARAGDEVDVVVLAQASMAGAADLVEVGVPVLSSPRLAVERILS